MRAILIALLVGGLAMGQTGRSQETAVMTTVNRFVVSFNKGDIKTAMAACADDMAIIDEVPPHEWHGAGAMSKWLNDYGVDAKKRGITDGSVKIGKPRHVDISGSHAYVVVPADYTYKVKGSAVKESGSVFTLALRKDAAGWRITAWSWSKG